MRRTGAAALVLSAAVSAGLIVGGCSSGEQGAAEQAEGTLGEGTTRQVAERLAEILESSSGEEVLTADRDFFTGINEVWEKLLLPAIRASDTPVNDAGDVAAATFIGALADAVGAPAPAFDPEGRNRAAMSSALRSALGVHLLRRGLGVTIPTRDVIRSVSFTELTGDGSGLTGDGPGQVPEVSPTPDAAQWQSAAELVSSNAVADLVVSTAERTYDDEYLAVRTEGCAECNDPARVDGSFVRDGAADVRAGLEAAIQDGVLADATPSTIAGFATMLRQVADSKTENELAGDELHEAVAAVFGQAVAQALEMPEAQTAGQQVGAGWKTSWVEALESDLSATITILVLRNELNVSVRGQETAYADLDLQTDVDANDPQDWDELAEAGERSPVLAAFVEELLRELAPEIEALA